MVLTLKEDKIETLVDHGVISGINCFVLSETYSPRAIFLSLKISKNPIFVKFPNFNLLIFQHTLFAPYKMAKSYNQFCQKAKAEKI